MKNCVCRRKNSSPLFLFFILFLAGALQAFASASIALHTPTANSDWCKGAHYNITWTSSEIANVKIELSADGGITYPTVLVANTSATTGTWSWLVPNEQSVGTQYKVRISDATNASVRTESSLFHVRPSVVITSQPQSWWEPVCDGAPVTVAFSVSATGHNVRYQWKHNGVAIAGATDARYTFSSPQASQAGNYTVVVTGSCGEVESHAATLMVYQQTALGESDTDPRAIPAQQIICAGTPAEFSIRARGTDLVYQWRRNGVSINGATSREYTIPSATAAHAGNYDVVVSGACGSVTSESAQLIVNPTTAIAKQPEPRTVCAGTAVAFAVEATGASLTYQWRRDGVNIDGANKPEYTIGNPTVSGNYDVVVRGCAGSIVTSNSVALIVHQVATITKQPVGVKVCSGMPMTLTVGATGTDVTYQWRKDGNDIKGATASRYTVAETETGDAGIYDVVVDGLCKGKTSDTVRVTVYPTTVITQQPVSLTVCERVPATFSVEAQGANIVYQWRKNGIAIAGATSAQYTTLSAKPADAGEYDVVISIPSSNCGTMVSKPAVLTVNERPKITTPPGLYTVCLGEPVTLSVEATGTDITYQWRKSGEAIKGATENNYTITTVRREDLGEYDVVVQGRCTPSVTSSKTVVQLAKTPVFTVQPVSQIVCEGSAMTLRAEATYAEQYAWYKNGVLLPGAIGERYTLSSVDARAEGEYTCVVTGRCNQTLTSSTARISVTAKPIIRQQPSSVVAKVDEEIVLRVVATGEELSYEWRKNGTAISGATSTEFRVEKAQKSDEGIYSVAVQGKCTSVVSSVAFVTVTTGTAQAPVFTLSSAQLTYGTVDIGKQAELECTASNTGGGSITVTDVVIEGANAAEFRILNALSLPRVLTATDSPLALRVACIPTTEGEKNAVVVLQSNGITLGTVQLSGRGRSVSSGSPKLTSTSGESINFGVLELPASTSKRMEVKVKNTGTAVANVTEAFLSGAQSNAFAIISSAPALPTALQPDAEMTIVVEYKPTTTGTARANLLVQAEGISTSLTIQLVGEARQQTVSVGETILAAAFSVAPNPATDMAVIRFTLKQPFASVQMSVVDAFGRKVRHLGAFNGMTGEQRVQWDGRDDSGRLCASGFYRVVLSSSVSLQSLPVRIVR